MQFAIYNRLQDCKIYKKLVCCPSFLIKKKVIRMLKTNKKGLETDSSKNSIEVN